MHNINEEQYVFYRMALSDIQSAKRVCDLALKQTDNELKYSMIRDAIVIYCRPFSRCNGKFGSHKLDKHISDQLDLSIHRRLIQWRDQIIAHSDIDVRDPKLHCWTNLRGNTYPIVFTGFYGSNMPKEEDIKSICEKLEEILLLKIKESEAVFSANIKTR